MVNHRCFSGLGSRAKYTRNSLLSIGIAVDRIAAYAWWFMADTSVKITTGEKLDELKKQITDAKIKIAQTTSSKCFQSNYQDCEAEMTQMARTF